MGCWGPLRRDKMLEGVAAQPQGCPCSKPLRNATTAAATQPRSSTPTGGVRPLEKKGGRDDSKVRQGGSSNALAHALEVLIRLVEGDVTEVRELGHEDLLRLVQHDL